MISKSDIIYASSELHMQENTRMKENMSSTYLLEKKLRLDQLLPTPLLQAY